MPPVEILTWNEKLETAAILHSEDMFKNNYFDHINKQGLSPSARITNAGYIWSDCGENIANGQLNVVQAMTDWINSEGHCKNIMNKDFKDIGVGHINKYWTQNFGAK